MQVLLTKTAPQHPLRPPPTPSITGEILALELEKLYRAVITRTVRFAEAARDGLPITRYLPQSPAAQQYRKLAKEVLRDAQEEG